MVFLGMQLSFDFMIQMGFQMLYTHESFSYREWKWLYWRVKATVQKRCVQNQSNSNVEQWGGCVRFWFELQKHMCF